MTLNQDQFVHLHNHSEYSLLDGYGHVKDMATRAAELGQPAMALTDHGNVYAAIDFYRAAQDAGIKPIIGMEGYVAFESRHDRNPAEGGGGSQPHITLLAENLTGYRNLLALSSKGHLEGFYYRPRVDRELLAEYSEGIVVLSGCLSGELARDILKMEGDLSVARKTAGWYREVFGDRYYLELMHHEKVPGQDMVNRAVLELQREMGIETVVTNDCHYVYPEDAPHQDVLTCIMTSSKLAQQNRLRMEDTSYYIKSAAEMQTVFPDQPQALLNTLAIAERCDLTLSQSRTRLPQFPTPNQTSSDEYLREICIQGARKRFDDHLSDTVMDRLEKELHIIRETDYADYFLVVWDIFKFVKRNNILSTVRGSAASSLVLFCLEVTDFDPLQYGLFFERFLSVERREMPDIDMEFADDRRGEVISYVLERYGPERVAQITTFGTMRSRAALRDVARVLEGGEYEEVAIRDACSKLVRIASEHSPATSADDDDDAPPRDHNLATIHRENAEMQRLCRDNPIAADILARAKGIEGRVRNVSTHAAGVVISDEPLVNHVALQRPTKSTASEVPATQYSMYPLEYVGLLKWDFLGLTNLAVLDRCIKIVTEESGEEINIYEVPLDDTETFALMAEGDTFGSFQLEGAGMTRYIKELKPSSIVDIAAMIALYRPGPMQHIDRFIDSKHGRTEIVYPHPSLAHLLEETYGVIVYQDQVMLAAQDFAGYTLGEADILRKAMGKKVPEIMREEERKFVAGAVSKGHSEEEGREIFSYILPFAGYGFNKAHAVSYAYITYWTTYFKAHYPVEYFVALLESFAGAPDRVRLCILDAKRRDISVLPPDINVSNASFTADKSVGDIGGIRYGLASIKGVGPAAVQQIVDVREGDGKGSFSDIGDFCDRMAEAMLGESVLKALIMAGAFDSLAPRIALLENLPSIVAHMKTVGAARSAGQGAMFGFSSSSENYLGIEFGPPQENGGIDIKLLKEWEKELFGISLTQDPEEHALMEHIRTEGGRRHTIIYSSSDDLQQEGKSVRVIGKVADVQRRSTRNGTAFISAKLAMLDGDMEFTVWSQTLEKTEGLWHEDVYVILTGSVRMFNNDASIEVSNAEVYRPDIARRLKETSIRAQSPTLRDAGVEYNGEHRGAFSDNNGNNGNVSNGKPSKSDNSASNIAGQNGSGRRIPMTDNKNGDPAVELLFSADASESPSREMIHKVILALHSHKGDGQVVAKLRVGGKIVSMEFPFFKVEPSEQLQSELNSILGEGNVVMSDIDG